MLMLQKMLTLFLLMGVGYFFRKKEWLTEENAGLLSKIVINVANPALMIAAGLDSATTLSNQLLLTTFLTAVIFYAVLILTAPLVVRILRIPKEVRGTYQFMYIFGNIGFMGIPLITSVYGTEYALLVSMFNFCFLFLIYTYGIRLYLKEKQHTLMQRSLQPAEKFSAASASGIPASDAAPAGIPASDAAPAGTPASDAAAPAGTWKKMINAGTISCLIALFFFLTKLQVPYFLSSTFDMLGDLCGPLSMFVIGNSLATIRPKDLFSDWKLNLFIVIRLVVIPIIGIAILSLLQPGELLLRVFYVMISVPIASMCVLMADEYGGNMETASRGVALSTIVSVITLPLVGAIFGL